MKYHRRGTEGVAAGEECAQISLAAFDRQEWNYQNPAIDSFFPDRSRHIGEIDLDNLHIAPGIESFFLQHDTKTKSTAEP